MRSKIKICGITRVEDALLAEELGADYIGLIFTSQSKRMVSVSQAGAITSRLTRVKPVGVFIEQDFGETLAIAAAAGLAGIQHYSLFDRKPGAYTYIYAQNAAGAADFSQPVPDYFLLDSHVDGQKGGTGQVFDWAKMPEQGCEKIFMAGGIGPHNIAEAMRYKPYAIDLSSGVEESPGIKDHKKLKQLFAEIENAEQL